MQRQVTFRGISPAANVVEEVDRQALKLGARLPSLETCDVVVQAGRRQQTYRVSVRLWGAGTGATLCSSVDETHVQNLRPAVHRAFAALLRKLPPTGARTRPELRARA